MAQKRGLSKEKWREIFFLEKDPLDQRVPSLVEWAIAYFTLGARALAATLCMWLDWFVLWQYFHFYRWFIAKIIFTDC